MKQRVALARALAPEPARAADGRAVRRARRDDARAALRRHPAIWEARRKTIIFVTHNVREAVCLGDRVVLLSPHPGPHRARSSTSTCRARATSTASSWRATPAQITAALQGHIGEARAVRMKRALVASLFFVALLALWQLRRASGRWSPVLLPSPLQCRANISGAALQDGTLLEAVWVTLRRLLVGYAIGVVDRAAARARGRARRS